MRAARDHSMHRQWSTGTATTGSQDVSLESGGMERKRSGRPMGVFEAIRRTGMELKRRLPIDTKVPPDAKVMESSTMTGKTGAMTFASITESFSSTSDDVSAALNKTFAFLKAPSKTESEGNLNKVVMIDMEEVITKDREMEYVHLLEEREPSESPRGGSTRMSVRDPSSNFDICDEEDDLGEGIQIVDRRQRNFYSMASPLSSLHERQRSSPVSSPLHSLHSASSDSSLSRHQDSLANGSREVSLIDADSQDECEDDKFPDKSTIYSEFGTEGFSPRTQTTIFSEFPEDDTDTMVLLGGILVNVATCNCAEVRKDFSMADLDVPNNDNMDGAGTDIETPKAASPTQNYRNFVSYMFSCNG